MIMAEQAAKKKATPTKVKPPGNKGKGGHGGGGRPGKGGGEGDPPGGTNISPDKPPYRP
jgi:hypothetical protein